MVTARITSALLAKCQAHHVFPTPTVAKENAAIIDALKATKISPMFSLRRWLFLSMASYSAFTCNGRLVKATNITTDIPNQSGFTTLTIPNNMCIFYKSFLMVNK
ncbi:uncharacterized protein LOC117108173 [Anneissia japonica]|uniref:uncharacterized protein LOC117108173 n=1 Tax=Anneissia japonica TaxID=1529436 RepID=UPI0014258E4C|nr:uncharacterized protein LOC117108173 [Anneissia japonica]